MNVDLLIRGGTLIDGRADARPEPADVAIERDRIIAVGAPGTFEPAEAREVIRADGLVVAPGFIDTHVHSEAALLRDDERFASLVQGVTTHLGGPDGFGVAGLERDAADALWRSLIGLHGRGPDDEDLGATETPAGWLERYRDRLPLDLVPTAPLLPIRFATMGWRTDPPTAAELARMRRAVEAWLEVGAAALTVGLDYAPAANATTDELVELASLLAPLGRRYVAHGRYRRSGREGAHRETIEVGRRAGVGVVISHEHMDEPLDAMLAGVDDVDLAFDSHLYPAGCTHLLYHVPEALQAGGVDALLERLADPAEAASLSRHLDDAMAADHARGAREIIASTGSGARVGEVLREAASRAGLTVGELAVRMIVEERADVLLVYQWAPWSGDETAFAPVADRTLRDPRSLVASDGLYRAGTPHPRGYGTFPHALALVRERASIPLPAAIHKMSGRPAEVYGLRDRGILRPGALAHAVVLDAASIVAGATWERPHVPPIGIHSVIVNGAVAVRDGRPTGVLAGRVSRADG